jgi:type I restriction enzyme R subunit
MGYNESDTRSKLIDPAIHARGWTEDLIKREETAGAIEIVEGKPRRRSRGRTDYTLRVKVYPDLQPVAVALIEAKAQDKPPTHGLEQAKVYAASKRLNVPFVFSSNGHLFVEYNNFTKLTSPARPLSEFPTPEELRARYEQGMGFSLADEAAKPLLVPYKGGETARRYYQDAAIRAALEKVAKGEDRALLTLATPAGKTFTAVNLLRRIADAGQLTRALFVCDRDELREQGLGAFKNLFGADAAPVTGDNPQKNARILVATYQTLDVDTDEAEANFLTTHYPENYFSHIVIDECHRSAWGKWSQVLTRNPDAVQIGLTATPRTIEVTEATEEAKRDERINADNIKHFGEPVYEYELGQGIEDGYLAACEIVEGEIFIDDKKESERKTGISKDDLAGKALRDPRTGLPVSEDQARPKYDAAAFEARLVLPDRVWRMAEDLFTYLLATGGPYQKTIVFCARDRHADAVAIELNNIYARWCHEQGQQPYDFYAFKCTQASGGNDALPDFRAATHTRTR